MHRICPVRRILFDIALSVAKWEREGWRLDYECEHWMSKRNVSGKECEGVGTGDKGLALDEAGQTKFYSLNLAFPILLYKKD